MTGDELPCGCPEHQDWPGHDSGPILAVFEQFGPSASGVALEPEACLVEATRWVASTCEYSDNTVEVIGFLKQGGDVVDRTLSATLIGMWKVHYRQQGERRRQEASSEPRRWVTVSHPVLGDLLGEWMKTASIQWYRDEFEPFGCLVRATNRHPITRRTWRNL